MGESRVGGERNPRWRCLYQGLGLLSEMGRLTVKDSLWESKFKVHITQVRAQKEPRVVV